MKRWYVIKAAKAKEDILLQPERPTISMITVMGKLKHATKCGLCFKKLFTVTSVIKYCNASIKFHIKYLYLYM